MVSTSDTAQRSQLTQLRIPIRTTLVHQSAPCHINNSSRYPAVRLCAPASTISAHTVQDSINFFGFVATHLHFTDGAVHSPVLYQYNFCCNRSGLPLNTVLPCQMTYTVWSKGSRTKFFTTFLPTPSTGLRLNYIVEMVSHKSANWC